MSGPLKLAIVGGGPSGFYLASRLLQLLPQTHPNANDLRIHIYDRLWAPHGLVRYGVAPDHPEVKNCTHKFDSVASDPRVRFLGNVHVAATPTPYPPLPQTGHALPLALRALFPCYTHLLFATGASLPRLHPALPRSPLCVPALDLVHWYTLHPSSSSSGPASPPIPPRDLRHLTLIGHGNVSLDIARLLLTPPERLATLDIPRHVLAALHHTWHTLQHVSIVGRRGPREARFTAKEVREMMQLSEAEMLPIPQHVMDDAERGPLYKGVAVTRQEGRILKLLREGSVGKERGSGGGSGSSRTAREKKTFSFEFWSNPTGYTPLPAEGGGGAMLTLEETQLDPETGRAVPSGRTRSTRTDLIVTSLGYRTDPAMLAAADEQQQQWYNPAQEHVRNKGGRVLTAAGRLVKNVYASGWAAHGARGVLAGTLMDANDVAAVLLQDHFGQRAAVEPIGESSQADLAVSRVEDPVEVLAHPGSVEGGLDGLPDAVELGVKNGQVLEYGGWRRVEEEERNRGEAGGKERERMQWSDVTAFLHT